MAKGIKLPKINKILTVGAIVLVMLYLVNRIPAVKKLIGE